MHRRVTYHGDDSIEILLGFVFSYGRSLLAILAWMVDVFDIVHPAFPLPTTVSPTLQGALKDGSGEAVAECEMPEPRESPSLDNCQKRFLWAHKGVDHATHPVVGLVLSRRTNHLVTDQ